MNNILKERYYVGISGHRDLKQTEIENYKTQLIEKLQYIVEKQPSKEVVVLSPLADGADRIMVNAAKTLKLRYEVLFPMPEALYELDFDETSRYEFRTFRYEARLASTIALSNGCTQENIKEYGKERDVQYKAVGLEVVKRSDEMLFLWDGIDNGLIGGTADIVKYTEKINKSYFIVECKREIRERLNEQY